MPARKTSKNDPPGDKCTNRGKQGASSFDPGSDSNSDSDSDSSTSSDSTLGDAERLSKKKRKQKKPKKKNKGKGKRKMEDDEEDEATALRDENARLQQELANQNRRDMLNAARPSQTTGAGPSNANTGHNTDADADADTKLARIPIPKKKADITIELLLGYFDLTDSHKDHQKWLEWRDLIRHWMSMANLDYDLPWKQQDKSQLGKLYDLIRARIPAFKRFVNNWAAEYLVQDAFNHRRGHRMAKARDNEDDEQSPRKKRKVSTKTKQDKAAHAPARHTPNPPSRQGGDQSDDTGMSITGEQDHTQNASPARDQSNKRKHKHSAKNTDQGPSRERVQEERDRERELWEREHKERERKRKERERERAELESEQEREEVEREQERERERKQWEREREKWEQERKEWERERERESERQREKERERKREELEREEREREEELQRVCEREQRENDQTTASFPTKSPGGKSTNNGSSGRGRGGAPRRQRGLNIQVDGAPPASTGMTTRSRAGKKGCEDRGKGNTSADEDGGSGDDDV